MRDSLSSSFIPFGGVKDQVIKTVSETQKNKMGQSTLLSSISKSALDVLAEQQALLDYNQPFKPFGNKVFYYNGFDWVDGAPNGHGTIFF